MSFMGGYALREALTEATRRFAKRPFFRRGDAQYSMSSSVQNENALDSFLQEEQTARRVRRKTAAQRQMALTIIFSLLLLMGLLLRLFM